MADETRDPDPPTENRHDFVARILGADLESLLVEAQAVGLDLAGVLRRAILSATQEPAPRFLTAADELALLGHDPRDPEGLLWMLVSAETELRVMLGWKGEDAARFLDGLGSPFSGDPPALPDRLTGILRSDSRAWCAPTVLLLLAHLRRRTSSERMRQARPLRARDTTSGKLLAVLTNAMADAPGLSGVSLTSEAKHATSLELAKALEAAPAEVVAKAHGIQSARAVRERAYRARKKQAGRSHRGEPTPKK